MSWSSRFDQPIPLPGGGELRTLRDAGNYIAKLPKTTHDTPSWQLAIQVLIDAAEGRGPTLHARMGIHRALHPPGERVYHAARKDRVWRNTYKLVRDR